MDTTKAKDVAIRLMAMVPYDADISGEVRKKATLEDGELAPFFSEAFLYELIGKEEARTVLSLINQLVDACGLDVFEVRQEASKLRFHRLRNGKGI